MNSPATEQWISDPLDGFSFLGDRFPLAGTKIEAAPSHIEKQPAFPTLYPRIRNGELIEAGCLAAMEESWKRGVFPERDLKIFHLKRVYLVNEGMIFDQDLQLISNASDHRGEDIERAAAEIARQEQARTLPHSLGRPAVMAKRQAAHNYGHFIIEMLPMAYIGRLVIGHAAPDYVIHQVPAPTLDVAFRAFRLLGFSLQRLIIKDYWQPVFFEDLITVRGLTEHGTYMSPLCIQVMDLLASKVRPGHHRRIFVRRRPGWQRGRALLNEDEVCARLSAKGFPCIEPSELSLEEQIASFAGADLVVGVSGAAMTNIAFCRPEITVISLVPGTFADTFFWFIANLKQINYVEIRGDQPVQEGPEAQTADFTLREADIRFLEAL